MLYQSNVTDFLPQGNDEVGYWHEILTFTEYNFSGGYYNIEEKPAQATFSQFGEHGPLFVIFSGIIGKIFGWKTYTGELINFFLISLSMFTYLMITRPERTKLIIISLFFITTWGLIMYLPSNYQETFHQSFAIISAGLFVKITKDNLPTRIPLAIGTSILILIVSISRFTWLLLLIPCMFILFYKQPKLLVISLLISIIAILGLTFVIASLYAPYPDAFYPKLINTLGQNFHNGVLLLFQHTKSNILDYFQIGLDDPYLGIVQRYQVLFIIIFLLVLWVKRLISSQAGFNNFLNVSSHLVIGLLIFLPIFITQIMFYDVYYGRDYRVFIPYILLTILLIIPFEKKLGVLLTGIIILSNLIFSNWFYKDYQFFHWGQFNYFRSNVIAFQNIASHILTYSQNDNHWCNTLLTNNYPQEFVGVPAGIGISYIMSPERITFPLKSKYLLLEDKLAKNWRHNNNLKVKPLGTSEFGTFYLNLSVNCD